jgi:Holliday junction DNA helicase RuvA
MIAKLRGEIVAIQPARIVIDVGGVGYLVFTPSTAGFVHGETVRIHTHLAVRENALDLYGFKTEEELLMFEMLIKLPKIGPKTAIQILSQADITIIITAVRTDDASYLTKMSGIGNKSAEKIVAGLKDILPEGFGSGEQVPSSTDTDVLDALVSLGYSIRDAQQAVQKIPSDITETHDRIKHALKYVSG